MTTFINDEKTTSQSNITKWLIDELVKLLFIFKISIFILLSNYWILIIVIIRHAFKIKLVTKVLTIAIKFVNNKIKFEHNFGLTLSVENYSNPKSLWNIIKATDCVKLVITEKLLITINLNTINYSDVLSLN